MSDRSAVRAGRSSSGQSWWTSRWMVGLLLVVLALVFIVENRQPAEIRLWIPVVIMPLWAALALMLIIGGLAGFLLRRRP